MPKIEQGLGSLDRWYLECHRVASEHLGDAPTLLELATWIGRTTTPIHRRLTYLETLGYLRRDERGRFMRTGKAIP